MINDQCDKFNTPVQSFPKFAASVFVALAVILPAPCFSQTTLLEQAARLCATPPGSSVPTNEDERLAIAQSYAAGAARMFAFMHGQRTRDAGRAAHLCHIGIFELIKLGDNPRDWERLLLRAESQYEVHAVRLRAVGVNTQLARVFMSFGFLQVGRTSAARTRIARVEEECKTVCLVSSEMLAAIRARIR
jgi:hypothetical protein